MRLEDDILKIIGAFVGVFVGSQAIKNFEMDLNMTIGPLAINPPWHWFVNLLSLAVAGLALYAGAKTIYAPIIRVKNRTTPFLKALNELRKQQ